MRTTTTPRPEAGSTRKRESARKTARGIPLARTVGLLIAGVLAASPLMADGAEGAAPVVVSTAKTASYGTILVSGTTVYTLQASSTPCTAKCLKIWPAVLLPKGEKKAKAGAGVNAAKLGTLRRSGRLQVTYAGRPLYWFYQDSAEGQVKGNLTDTWGKWSVVVTAKSASTGTGSGTGNGGSSAGTGGVSF